MLFVILLVLLRYIHFVPLGAVVNYIIISPLNIAASLKAIRFFLDQQMADGFTIEILNN